MEFKNGGSGTYYGFKYAKMKGLRKGNFFE